MIAFFRNVMVKVLKPLWKAYSREVMEQILTMSNREMDRLGVVKNGELQGAVNILAYARVSGGTIKNRTPVKTAMRAISPLCRRQVLSRHLRFA